MYCTIELKKLLSGAAIFLAILIPGTLYLLGGRGTDNAADAMAAAEQEVQTAAEAAAETGGWGLSFRTPGQPPVADASAESLAVYDTKYIGNTEQKTLYLTFDCGYENGCTGKMLDVLKEHGIHAAFFVVGNYIESNPELIRRMASEGHIVGNHTWKHPDMSKINDEITFSEQLSKVREAYEACTGQEMPMYYRPPQGEYSVDNLKLAQKLGYKTVFWSLAYVDWKTDDQPAAADAIKKLNERVHNGAVILLHNTSTTNAEILDELLTGWENQGYTFGTLDELFAD